MLAGVYAVTKGPIDAAQAKANNEACSAVVSNGDSVKDSDEELVKKAVEFLGSHDLSGTEVKEGDTLSNYIEISEVHPTEQGGSVYLADATKGYGGKISFALGVDETGAITGIAITSQSETAGLGANCENESWQAGFTGKVLPDNRSDEMYSKNGESESQIQALSGATVTSRAITRAVKAILFYNETVKEG